MVFSILKKDKKTKARLGILRTAHGNIMTPAFIPVGTRAAVRSLASDEIKSSGAQAILANTYHLWLQPGDNLIKKAGGLHKFMDWDGPIFTDSGGFQIFSLGERKWSAAPHQHAGGGFLKNSGNNSPFNVKISDDGVSFQSGKDGSVHKLTPEKSVRIQANLGSDISLVLDYFCGYPFKRESAEKSVELTTKWAERAGKEFLRIKKSAVNKGQLQFGIIQGAGYKKLREKSAKEISALDFDGYAIGGVAVGEPEKYMYQAVEFSVPFLEENKPRHLLGVGTPENIIEAVKRGCDTFDCVIPTREARHGKAYIFTGEGLKYKTMDIKKKMFAGDFKSLDPNCDCFACARHTRAYIHHLYQIKEILGLRLMTEHNLMFYNRLMEKIRASV
ncbi:MAG: queuine tRNA-ribosyltransferase [Parcubacteria group bacterium Licking1014_17]|nr:MAG: queuine tRNA-ribosyltransferase [Parcubacteria group bacterium Licking1014_17]